MKKLMIAAAIVCAAAMSNAAVINWNFSESIWTGEAMQSPGAQDLTGYKLYVFDAATWTAQETVTANTFLLALGNGATALTAAPEDYGDGYVMTTYTAKAIGVEAPAGKVDGDTVDLMYVVVNADESKYQALAGQLAADVYTAGGQGTPTSGKFDVNDELASGAGVFTTAGMMDVQGGADTPEPTSGLLLLLGVAGLALRRKQK